MKIWSIYKMLKTNLQKQPRVIETYKQQNGVLCTNVYVAVQWVQIFQMRLLCQYFKFQADDCHVICSKNNILYGDQCLHIAYSTFQNLRCDNKTLYCRRCDVKLIINLIESIELFNNFLNHWMV